MKFIEVRCCCCCQPQKLLGHMGVPDDFEERHGRRVTWATPPSYSHKQGVLFFPNLELELAEYRDGPHRFIAFKAEGASMDALRKLRYFRPAS